MQWAWARAWEWLVCFDRPAGNIIAARAQAVRFKGYSAFLLSCILASATSHIMAMAVPDPFSSSTAPPLWTGGPSLGGLYSFPATQSTSQPVKRTL